MASSMALRATPGAHEKDGKHHEMPAHHNLEAYLDGYLAAAGMPPAVRL